MISKDSVKGHLSLIRKHLFNARQGEMMMRAHLARITTSLDELAKKLELTLRIYLSKYEMDLFQKRCARGHF